VIKIVVNGIGREISPEPDRSLLSVLREELRLTGPKYGCGEGECGACTVLVDGEAVRSCTLTVSEVIGRSVTTVEGLARDSALHAVQRAFLETGAVQCGYCTPGMILSAAALLERTPDPTEPAIRAAMNKNVCRCCTYPRIIRAVERAAELARQQPSEPGMGAGPSAPRVEEAERPTGHGRPNPLSAPDAPWDLKPPEQRDYFSVLPDGLVVVLPQRRVPPGTWSTTDGAWIHVGADGTVTGFTGKVDVGQDNRTALSQLVAEELHVPFGSVRLVMGDTDLCPFDMGTFGSRSMPDAGEDLRVAAASARELLLSSAADRWGEDPAGLVASDGSVATREGGRSVSYAELLQGVRRVEIASGDAPVSAPSQWRVAGRPTPRANAEEIVTGARFYPSDHTAPGVLHGKVLRPPAFGATLRSVDLAEARGVPGVTVVHESDFVGVAAEDPVAARAALRAIRAEWELTAQPSERDLVEHLRSHPAEAEGYGGALRRETGDVDRALAEAKVRLAETYTTAYIAHVPLEPRAALAEWAGGRLTVWTGTQRPFGVRQQLAEELGIDEADIRVIVPPTGAGFGGKHSGETAVEAARLARGSERPVKVRWTREEEFTWGFFRPAAVIDVQSGAAADGALIAWKFTNINSGSAGIFCPYDVPNQRIAHRPAASPLRQGSYRALAATANHFARESHIDEMAHRVDADPLEFRLRHLPDERLATVFRTAAERAGWAGRSDEPGRALGIAGGLEKDARVATCVELRVLPDGRPEILRIVTAFDCGAIVNPDNLMNQIEGATVMGLGGALFEAVHFSGGRISNPRLSQYRVPRFSDVPPIELVLVDRKDIAPAGAGETPIVAVAPAIANAISAATGRRIRSMPLVPDGVVP
jgi:nicotinate dehydrogenase subunit B